MPAEPNGGATTRAAAAVADVTDAVAADVTAPEAALAATVAEDVAAPATPKREGSDAALLRRTRWRLIAWSGGLTLLILAVLGVVLYGAVAGSLATRGTALLERRAQDIGRYIARAPVLPDRQPLGIPFGGEATGTLALVVGPDGTVLGQGDLGTIEGIPDTTGVAAARSVGHDVRETRVASIPVRIYSLAVTRTDGTYVVEVVGERASEQQLLGTLVTVLGVGGLVALLLAVAAGYLYAGRALVPIRASIARREEALRRQREFAANASHELRTPLAVIQASVTDLQRNRTQPVEAVGAALEDIDAEVTHLAALVDDLLLVARADSGVVELERTPLDLADIAVEAVGALTPLAAGQGVALIADPLPCLLEGDPVRLRQLVTILVDNAIGHSPGGTTVAVRIRPEGADASLTVEDTGPGIRAEDMPRLFERFWRADDAPAGGTGLGLAIAAWIVERHGGTIAAANRPEGGARFEVRLPLGSASSG